jgi:hypothetical protein
MRIIGITKEQDIFIMARRKCGGKIQTPPWAFVFFSIPIEFSAGMGRDVFGH